MVYLSKESTAPMVLQINALQMLLIFFREVTYSRRLLSVIFAIVL